MSAAESERVAPTATCPTCAEVLLMTFERRGKEFICLGCGAWWEFLQPRAVPTTPETEARHEELVELFKAGVRRIEPT